MCMNGCQQQRLKQRIRKPHMQTHHVEDEDTTVSDEKDIYRLLRLTDSWAKQIQNTVNMNKILITVELDNGASLSIISHEAITQIDHIKELK